jgi:hypothetical protein
MAPSNAVWEIGGGLDLIDFRAPPTDHHLPPLSTFTQSLVNIAEGLNLYLSTIERGHSLAANRGEKISAAYLSQQLGRLFTTTEPELVRGPRADWTQVVLFQDSLSRNTQDDTYTLGESVMRIPEVDMELISSDRPRQFLTPWPPSSDIQKELETLDAITVELGDLMKAMSSRQSWALSFSSRLALRTLTER